MRLLVTGGCGFIGSNFIRYILEHYDPEFVTNVDALTEARNLANVAGLAERYGERYEFLQADIVNAELMETLMQKHHFYAVVNFAAESRVDDTSTQDFSHTNVTGTSVLLEAARRHGVRRFLQVSSGEVYGPPGAEGRFTEESPLQPGSPYAASKAEADMLALTFHKTYGEEVVITRCANHYGPYQHPEKFVPRMILNALRDLPVPVDGDGRNDWIHVDDHCAALVAALLNGRTGEVYNIGANAEWKDLDLAHRILDHLGKPRDLVRLAPGRPAYALDSSKIRRELGWKPLHRPEKGIPETVDWYAANRAWWEKLVL